MQTLFKMMLALSLASVSLSIAAVTSCPSGNPKACFEKKSQSELKKDQDKYARELHNNAEKAAEQAKAQTQERSGESGTDNK